MRITKTIDILIPVFNESTVLLDFWEKLNIEALNDLNKRSDVDYFVWFLNNASTDGSLEILRSLAQRHENVRVITYTRNIGYQNSIYAGYSLSSSDATIVIDCDGEDPPNLIITFINLWISTHNHVIYGERGKRMEPFFLTICRRAFYWAMKKTADVEVVPHMAEFSLISRVCREFVLQSAAQNDFPFLRAEMVRSGLSRQAVPYDRNTRLGGKSNYNFLGSAKFAIAAFLTSSTLPLRLGGVLGILLFPIYILLGFIGMTWWSYILCSCYISSMVGFLSLYVARIYSNQLKRPRFLINESSTFNYS